MTNPVGVGSLFGPDAHSRFLSVTRQRYESMKARLKKKQLDVPFDLDDLRRDVLSVMGGKEDGAIICRYCNRPLALEECAMDHALPLSRGGGPELSNIDYPCTEDNQRKGSLPPPDYQALLTFLDTLHPLSRQDILSRLQKATTLAAGMFRNQEIIQHLKDNGQWQKALDAVNQRRKEKRFGLKPF